MTVLFYPVVIDPSIYFGLYIYINRTIYDLIVLIAYVISVEIESRHHFR